MPKMVEIDEAEFLNNQTLRQTVAKILANPQAAKLVEQAHKLVDPNAKTPRLDQEAIVTAPVTELKKTVEELNKKIEDDKTAREQADKLAGLKAKVDAGYAQLRKDGWTDEGIEGVKKLSEEKGILDPLDAAAIFLRDHPPQAPATPSGGTGAWNFVDSVGDNEADLKKLLDSKGDNNMLVDKMARDALNEIRGPMHR